MRTKERFRPIGVCYDNYTQFGWRTAEEFAELLNQGRVTWFSYEGLSKNVYVNNDKIKEQINGKTEPFI